MRKISLLVGASAGFLLGSRAGRGPYEQLESKVRRFAGRSDVQAKVDEATYRAKEHAESAVETLTNKVMSTDPEDPTLPAGCVPNSDDAVSP